MFKNLVGMHTSGMIPLEERANLGVRQSAFPSGRHRAVPRPTKVQASLALAD